MCRHDGHVILLHVNYGQITFAAEQRAIQQCCSVLALGEPISLCMAEIAAWGRGTLVTGHDSGPSSDYFPHRNLFLVSCGLIVASSFSAKSVVSGIIDSSQATYSDCQLPFIRHCADTVRALAPDIEFLTPLAHMTKRDVVQLATELHVPLGLTFSCNARNDRHCWDCVGCIERMRAFLDVGLHL